ncbi:hypothetical protein ACFVVU_05865 [Kitasatospora sp. NPDC057965]|uniref:hypothetical protein n=1 Tax=Kitasatospora sp. NPDC057965 TaxID=3346291 RepID=UPI0036DD3575
MRGQHRGSARDPISTALQTVWITGHLVVLGLLGALTDHQLTGDPLPRIAASTPDTEPLAPSI